MAGQEGALYGPRSLCQARPEKITRPDWGHGPWLWDVQLPHTHSCMGGDGRKHRSGHRHFVRVAIRRWTRNPLIGPLPAKGLNPLGVALPWTLPPRQGRHASRLAASRDSCACPFCSSGGERRCRAHSWVPPQGRCPVQCTLLTCHRKSQACRGWSAGQRFVCYRYTRSSSHMKRHLQCAEQHD